MSSKVKCTCGWSWNKSDSSKKDMYVCHNCGKDNTMKNGGWLSKFDAPEAQNGIEGTMGGLTDKGFNYNGAWGGTMQRGGSLPGSVGFSYARTQDPAPSKGKYAKKTMASAQNGEEMKFYQEGLDWKPKTISQNGSVVPNWASDLGTRLSNAVSTFGGSAIGDAVKGVSPQAADWLNESTMGFIPYTTDEELMATRAGNPNRGLNAAVQASDAVSNVLLNMMIGPLAGKANTAIKKGAGKVSKAAGTFAKDFTQGYKQIATRKDGGIIEDDRGQWEHPGEITKINSNQITMQGVDYPVLGISDTGDTQMMQPGQDYTYEGESVTEYPMMQGGGKASLRSLMNNDGLKSKSDNTKVVPKLIRSTTEGEGDNSILRAIRQHLYKTVQPADYADAEGNIRPIVEGILKNKNRFDIEGKEKKYSKLNAELMAAHNADDREKVDILLPQVKELENQIFEQPNVGGIDDPYSEAGWKKYLGLTDPKKDTVFTKSNYRPSEGKEKNVNYYSLPKAFEEDLLEVYYTNTNNGKNKLESTAFNEGEFSGAFGEGKSRARVLGNFKIDEGEDDKGKYVSYYDKYDLSPKLPLLGDTSIDFLGKPFEIYNRIYLNNSTGKKENGGWLSKYN